MCPVKVVHKPIKGNKDFAIVEKDTGKVVGRSETRAKAQASANARNASRYGWKSTNKK